MPSSKQRLEVWRGVRQKTSGGLRKADLVKNARGKIVSRKKSKQAGDQNNLGDYLRDTGKTIPKDKMLQPKKVKKVAPKKVKVLTKPKVAPKAAPQKVKVLTKPKAAPKAAPQKVKVLTNAPKKQAPAKKAAVRKKTKPGINPLTQQPYAKKSGTGYVASADVHLDNLKRRGRRYRAPVEKFADPFAFG
jgi:hypothetical protein